MEVRTVCRRVEAAVVTVADAEVAVAAVMVEGLANGNEGRGTQTEEALKA